jgi:hypothetical protein
MPLAVDRSQYAFAPRISVSTGATLIGQLIDAARDPELEPSAAIEQSAKELAKVRTRARSADVAATTASATSTAVGDVPLDQRADRIIKAIMLRLQGRVLLDDGEPAQRAAEHLTLLYPEGLAFTKTAYAAQDAVMQRMLTQIKTPELAASLAEIVGAEYITAFKKVGNAYHKMVKAMGRVVTNTIDQRTVLIDMQTVIVQHASRILGELYDADPKSVQRTRALLAPIDNFRARANQGTAGPPKAADPAAVTDADDEPDTDA